MIPFSFLIRLTDTPIRDRRPPFSPAATSFYWLWPRERESCERAMDPPTKDSLCMCVRVVCLSIDLGSPSFLPSECFKHEGRERERDKPGMKQLDSHRLGSRRHHHSGRAVEMHYGEERGQKYKRESEIEKEIHQSAKWVGYGGSPSSRASNTIRRKDASPDLIESKASHSSREEGKRESWTAAHNFGARHTRRLNSQWDSCLCVCFFLSSWSRGKETHPD